MAKRDEVNYDSLCSSMRHSSRVMEPFRVNRREAVKQFVGRHYSENGADKEVPVNLIGVYISVVSRSLISKAPRFLFSTFNKKNRPAVATMNDWVNREMKRMKVQKVYARIAVDALFSIGIGKVCLAKPAEYRAHGYPLPPGKPFISSVDLDDFLFDPHCRTLEKAAWFANRIRLPLEEVKRSRVYSSVRKQLLPSDDPQHNPEGDERIDMILRGYNAQDREEFEPMVDLWEVYLPRQGRVLTLPDSAVRDGYMGNLDEPLLDQEWVGPACGPFHFLSLGPVPGNPMPKAPIMDIRDLHDAANRAYRKTVRMLDRMKENTFISGTASNDGSRIQDADDGDIIRVDNPSLIKNQITGGQAIPNVWLLANGLRDLVSFVGGNLAVLGGRGAETKTATQEKLLDSNASAGIADMQDWMVDFVSATGEAMGWYYWKDPFTVQKAPYSPEGIPEVQTMRESYPAGTQGKEVVRSGPFEDLDIRVDPYSLRSRSPQECIAMLDELVIKIIMPMQPVMQAAGVAFDIQAYLSKRAKYMDLPDVTELITVQEPVSMGGGDGGGDTPGMPQETTRNYVRESVPGRSRQGDEKNMMNALQGIDTGGANNGQGA